MDIEQLMRWAVEHQASDLHLTVGSHPMIRLNGELRPITKHLLQPNDTEAMVRTLVNDHQWTILKEYGELDFSYGIAGVSRFRINVFLQRGCYSLAIRLVPTHIPDLTELMLPEILREIIKKPQGLFLVTGPTGSGKSTTLAAMISLMNQTQTKHIITLEDPIEYLHRHQLSIIDQREVGFDTKSFANGLRAALRQDPDVILIGEMRDLETIQTAITAAETGHLVFATLHTPDAPQTIDRIVDVFPAYQQAQVRVQLASVLVGILSQRLFPSANQQKRIAACEILMNTPAVANLIRSEKVHQMKTTMQTGRQFGMQTMEMHLRELVDKGYLLMQTAHQYITIQ